jgi:predicted metal-dependent hydrolase
MFCSGKYVFLHFFNTNRKLETEGKKPEERVLNLTESQKIEYRIIYSGRRSIGISIGPASGVVVRAPYRTSIKTIENLVEAKRRWIKRHLENYRSSININNIKAYDDGSVTLLSGKEYRIRLIESGKYFIRPGSDNSIEIGLKTISEKGIVGPMLEKWYKSIAVAPFRTKFEELLVKYKEYDFRPSGLKIRVLRRRWGSCSSKGVITLSSELIKLDEIYLEYVILHELCHLRHHNHGKEFYMLLAEVFPDWKKRRNELKKYVL